MHVCLFNLKLRNHKVLGNLAVHTLCLGPVSDLELSQETYITAHLESNVLTSATVGDVE